MAYVDATDLRELAHEEAMRNVATAELVRLDEAWLNSTLAGYQIWLPCSHSKPSMQEPSSRDDSHVLDSFQVSVPSKTEGSSASATAASSSDAGAGLSACDHDTAVAIANDICMSAALTTSDAVRLCALQCIASVSDWRLWHRAASQFAVLNGDAAVSEAVVTQKIRAWMAESAPVAALGAHSARLQQLLETAEPEHLYSTLFALREELAYGVHLLGISLLVHVTGPASSSSSSSSTSSASSAASASSSSAAPIPSEKTIRMAQGVRTLQRHHISTLAMVTSACKLLDLAETKLSATTRFDLLQEFQHAEDDESAVVDEKKRPKPSESPSDTADDESADLDAATVLLDRATSLARRQIGSCATSAVLLRAKRSTECPSSSSSSSSASASTSSMTMDNTGDVPTTLSRWAEGVQNDLALKHFPDKILPLGSENAIAHALSEDALQAMVLVQRLAASIVAFTLTPYSAAESQAIELGTHAVDTDIKSLRPWGSWHHSKAIRLAASKHVCFSPLSDVLLPVLTLHQVPAVIRACHEVIKNRMCRAIFGRSHMDSEALEAEPSTMTEAQLREWKRDQVIDLVRAGVLSTPLGLANTMIKAIDPDFESVTN